MPKRVIYKNCRVNGSLVDLEVTDGIFTKVEPLAEEGIDLGGLDVFPGLIDIHTHGANGYSVYGVGEDEYLGNVEAVSTYFAQTATIGIGDCKQLSELVCQGFAEGKFDRVVVAYTYFQNMLSQIPKTDAILPIVVEETKESKYANALIEGSAEDLIAAIVPQYITGILYATVCEAAASEHGARRTAMNAANKNATEIIDTLVLKFNRARQAVITQEITEIVSGAEAL